MDWMNTYLSGKTEGEGERDSPSSSDESFKSARENTTADDTAMDSRPSRVAFEEMESSSAAIGEPSVNVAGVVMDSMAGYFTQPDSMVDAFSHDEVEGGKNDVQVDGDNGNPDDQQQGIQDIHSTPPPSAHQHPNKKRRLLSGRRAWNQRGDPLSKLAASPEGRQHSSTICKNNTLQIEGPPRESSQLPSSSQSIVGSPLRSPSPLIMSPIRTPLPQTADSTNDRGRNDNNASSGSKASATPKRVLDLVDKNVKSTPSKEGIVRSPIHPPSPMMMSPIMKPSPQMTDSSKDQGRNDNSVRSESNGDATLKGVLDSVNKNVTLTPSKDEIAKSLIRSTSPLMISLNRRPPPQMTDTAKDQGANDNDASSQFNGSAALKKVLDAKNMNLTPSKDEFVEAPVRSASLSMTSRIMKPSPQMTDSVNDQGGTDNNASSSATSKDKNVNKPCATPTRGSDLVDKNVKLAPSKDGIVGSPLRSPSPLVVSPIKKPSQQVVDSTNDQGGDNKNAAAASKASSTPKRALDLVERNIKLAPSKDGMDVDGNLTNNDHDHWHEKINNFPTTEPTMTDGAREERQRKQRMLHRMSMKMEAICRSMVNLSDNSYSFVYSDFTNVQNDAAIKDDGCDKEPGLPFIGPGVKEQYEMLRPLLSRGLLGQANDDDVEEGESNMNHVSKKAPTEGSKNDKNESDDSNAFLPTIKSNFTAILMGPRGHGKTLVLERCLASLSRSAVKRKEGLLERMMKSEHQCDLAQELYGQASFRVVRLNGLMFQGESAVVCAREIARQIGVMSQEERKRAKRRIKQMSIAKRKRRVKSLMRSNNLETPKSSKRQPKEERSAANKNGDQKKLFATSPAATPASLADQTQTPDNPTPGSNYKTESNDLRNRRSGFNTHIALLDEVLRTARVDDIPILIVLEEMDTFLTRDKSSNIQNVTRDGGDNKTSMQPQDAGRNDRQLLLYHLLDRVADHNFLVSLVGTTTDLFTINKLEKRVQSRAEGTSNIIYFGHDKSYAYLMKSLLGKFCSPPEAAGEVAADDEYNEQKAILDVRNEVKIILQGGRSSTNPLTPEEKDQSINDYALVQRVIQRNYELKGSDMRWVCEVFHKALFSLTSDISEYIDHLEDEKADWEITPNLSPKHVANALVTMGASMDYVSGTNGRSSIPAESAMELVRWGQLLGDPKHYSCILGTHPQLAALLDLSGPQVAILLAARRIAARDDTRANAGEEMEDVRRNQSVGAVASATMLVPLTYQRIQEEYTTSFVASGQYTISSDRYPPHVLYRSYMDLMELDLIRLKKDQCEGGGLQYVYNDALSMGTDISNLPLHVNLEWELEFMDALKAGLLQCSTALRDWGMKMN